MSGKAKVQRITVRINEEQSEFITQMCSTMGVSPSDFIRMTLNVMMSTARKTDAIMERAVIQCEEDMRRENEQTSIGDQL